MRKVTGLPAALGAAAFGIALTAMTAGAAHAANMSPDTPMNAPAVSKTNARLSASGIYADDNRIDAKYGEALSGSVATPLGHEFGVQADGLVANRQARDVAGIGGHLFWRDPSTGLVGLTASDTTADIKGPKGHLGIARFGGEGQLYSGPFTFAAQSGYQEGHHVKNGYYGSLTGYWYADPNMRFGLGAANDPVRDTTGLLDVEYMPRIQGLPGMALFADGRAGDNEFAAAQFGVRFYFGQHKSLEAGDREDASMLSLPDDTLMDMPMS